MRKQATFIGIALATIVGSAQAATEVQLDVNALNATASGGTFNTTFTGRLTLAQDGNSGLFGVLKNGNGFGIGFGGPYTGTNHAFSATFDFVGGNITGIGLSLSVASALDANLDNTYTASVAPGMGNIAPDVGKPGDFVITARTFGGMFNGATFAGVDVSEFFGFSNPGNFINFKVTGSSLNASVRSDGDVDVDIFVRASVIPLPSAVGMASMGLVGLASVRRRRTA